MAKRTKTGGRVLAEICMYGTHQHGTGWLAQLADGRLLGTGELTPSNSFTASFWLACQAISREVGETRNGDRVVVYAAGGLWRATANLGCSAYYGQLDWEPCAAVPAAMP